MQEPRVAAGAIRFLRGSMGEPPIDADPSPPKPRLVRQPRRSPIGIRQEDWERAKTDQERRRLIRIARGVSERAPARS